MTPTTPATRRYPAGRYPAGRGRRGWSTYAALVLLAVLLMVAVVAVFRRSSTGVQVIARGFAVQSSTGVRVDFDIVKAAGKDAVCAVRALGGQGEEVGFAVVGVPGRTDGERTTTVSYLLATTDAARTGEVTSCRLGRA